MTRVTFPFFTIGHSNRSLQDFVALLRENEIALVTDIRKMPGSRTNPQFNQQIIHDELARHQISYEHMAALGGLRRKIANGSMNTTGLWTNKSFRNYAEYALTEPFLAGIRHLIDRGHQQRCAFMCSEAVWWRCHRRIVADYLIANGETVFHIMGEGRLDRARLTAGAIVQPDRTVHYPLPMPPDGPEP